MSTDKMVVGRSPKLDSDVMGLIGCPNAVTYPNKVINQLVSKAIRVFSV